MAKISTISTTSTSAGILSWYKNVFRSFFIWMELSSVCATVNILNLQFFQVLCCFNKKGMSIRMPPSCTIHQISIVPDSYYTITYAYSITDLLTVGRSKKCLILDFTFVAESGNDLMPLGTIKAILAAVTIRMVCRKTCHDRSFSDCCQLFGQPRITVLGFNPPSPAICILNRYENMTNKINNVIRVSLRN